jgi:hypothetical protein
MLIGSSSMLIANLLFDFKADLHIFNYPWSYWAMCFMVSSVILSCF